MSEKPDRIWLEGPNEVTNYPGDQKYYVHEYKYDHLTEYRRAPTLPDVMEENQEYGRIGERFLFTQIFQDGWWFQVYNGDELEKAILMDEFGPEEGAFYGYPDLSNYQVQDGKIVRVEG